MNNFHNQLTQANETYDGKPYKEKPTYITPGLTEAERKSIRERYSREHMARMKATIDYTRNKMGDMGI